MQTVQRITRYPLLIKQIIHYTEPDQDLYAVQDSLNTVEGIVAGINEEVREVEGLERLRVLSEDLWIGGEGLVFSPHSFLSVILLFFLFATSSLPSN